MHSMRHRKLGIAPSRKTKDHLIKLWMEEYKEARENVNIESRRIYVLKAAVFIAISTLLGAFTLDTLRMAALVLSPLSLLWAYFIVQRFGHRRLHQLRAMRAEAAINQLMRTPLKIWHTTWDNTFSRSLDNGVKIKYIADFKLSQLAIEFTLFSFANLFACGFLLISTDVFIHPWLKYMSFILTGGLLFILVYQVVKTIKLMKHVKVQEFQVSEEWYETNYLFRN